MVNVGRRCLPTSADDHLVQVGEYDLAGPLRDLVTVVLAMGDEV
jgi:hypothetical protein